jgi:coenzyme F420-reducing hydrogenase beta subunit
MGLPDKKCTGCGACFNACPKHAISMNENRDGFLYPSINITHCVNCGLCEKVCPALNAPVFYPEANIVYAGWNKDDDTRIDSSSGGIFDPLARSILSSNGVVYGAAWDEAVSDLRHIRVSDVSDLVKLRKSKYQQSNIGEVYKLIKDDLANDKKVLFSGTPCQVAGLNKFISDKDKKNLYSLEILCHGVPSKKVIDNYLKMMEEKHHKKIRRIHFRFKDDKHPWRVSCCCYCCCDDGTVILDESTLDSIFWTGFLGNICLRECCATCDYAKSERGADITLGDFWGVWEDPSFIEDHTKGVSLIIPNSDKGRFLLESCKERIELRSANKNIAYKHNLTLSQPFASSKKRDYFFSKLGIIRYDRLIKKCFRRRFFTFKIKRVLGENFSNKVSSLLHR